MATRNSRNELPQYSKLTITRDSFKESISKRILIGHELVERSVSTVPHIEALERDYLKWNSFNSELLKASFDNVNNEYKVEYDASTISFINLGPSNPSEEYNDLIKKINIKIRRLEQLYEKADLLKVSDEILNVNNRQFRNTDKNKVFIVHGHDDLSKETVARLISLLGLSPIILHELPNAGKTIIEKFESNTEDIGFAIVLLTRDDVGKGVKDNDLASRARQNVILELGYFIGKLGRGSVVPLYEEGIELPSDLSGVVYIPLDKTGTWKYRLGKELQHAGYKVDLNRI